MTAGERGRSVNRDVVVNDRMETSVRGVFAAGDVAEHDGHVFGLWPIAAKQGETAAVNALGGNAERVSEVPATILKGSASTCSRSAGSRPSPAMRSWSTQAPTRRRRPTAGC